MAELSSCSTTALALDEPLLATASLVRSWLLLEQSGPWGADALRQSGLSPQVAQRLHDASLEHSVRVLLLRRPEPIIEERARCFVAHSAAPAPWMEERELRAPGEVLSLDMALLAQGARPRFGELRSDPLYVVCTNSRHDPCCGRLGRPIARALASFVGDAAWECSHVGGERFAANLVCFPHGLYFGRLEPETALQVVTSYEQGLIELEHYRGRAGDPFVVQAADFFVRRRRRLRRIDDLAYLRYAWVTTDIAEVDFATSDGSTLAVRVARSPDTRPRVLTCKSTTAGHPWAYSLVDIQAG